MTPALSGRRISPAHTAFLASASVATIALWIVSRGKWCDAVVDIGTEWIYADSLARGKLLYRDVIYWFGPVTPYFQSFFFRLFGSSFVSLAVCGVVGAAAILAALFFALRRVTSARPAILWTGLAVPALVFMPNSGGAILGMGYRIWHPAGFGLLACALACLPAAGRARRHSILAGICAGLAGLCRTEWGILTLASVLLASWAGFRDTGTFPRRALWTIASAAATFAAVLGWFLIAAGPGAVIRDAPVLLVGIPAETPAATVAGVFRPWRTGIGVLLYSSAVWAAAVSLAAVLAARGAGSGRLRSWMRTLLVLLAAILVLVAAGVNSGAVLFSAAPLVCLACLLTGLRRAPGPSAAALAGFGCLGLLAFHRRVFHIGDSGYIAPSLLFAFVCAAALLRTLVVRERERNFRSRFQARLDIAVALLVAAAFLGRAIQYSSDRRVAIPGTGGMLSALPEQARALTELAARVGRGSDPGAGLVVIPEGGVLNFLTGRRNPMRHKISIPGYLRESNEEDFLRDLSAAAPVDVVVLRRFAGEYGRGFFGEGYADRTLAWIRAHSVKPPWPAGGAEVYTISRRGS